MPDGNYGHFRESFPAIAFFDITPHDTNELDKIPRSVYIGSSGDLVVVGSDGVEVTFVGVPTGTVLPIQPKIVKTTNTTADNLIGLR